MRVDESIEKRSPPSFPREDVTSHYWNEANSNRTLTHTDTHSFSTRNAPPWTQTSIHMCIEFRWLQKFLTPSAQIPSPESEKVGDTIWWRRQFERRRLYTGVFCHFCRQKCQNTSTHTHTIVLQKAHTQRDTTCTFKIILMIIIVIDQLQKWLTLSGLYELWKSKYSSF